MKKVLITSSLIGFKYEQNNIFTIFILLYLQEKVGCRFLTGICGDLRRRLPHYWSDYKDGEDADYILLVSPIIWASWRENLSLRGFANNKGADQPALPGSLTSAFITYWTVLYLDLQ